MRRVLLSDGKRAICSPGFGTSVLVLVIAGVYGAVPAVTYVRTAMEFDSSQNFMVVLHGAMYSELFQLAVPLVASLAFGAAFAEELRARFVLESLPRVGWRHYLGSKMLVTSLSGGLVVLCSMVILFCAAILSVWPGTLQWQTLQPYAGRYAGQMFKWMVCYFLSGCLWSLVGGLFAAVMKNRYMAYAAPFILYYVLEQFQKRYYKQIYWLSPSEWVAPQTLPTWQSALILSVLVLTAGVAYMIIMKKRLRSI